MKKYLTLALLSIASAVSAQAVIVAGASAGYLVDSTTGYYAGRVGYQFNSSSSTAHIVELEAGYSSDREGGAKANLLPITLNYRAEFSTSEKWGTFVGAGFGQGRIQASYYWYRRSDWTNVGQVFGGISYKLNESSKLTLGARYIKFGKAKLGGYGIDVGDDVSIDFGVGVKF